MPYTPAQLDKLYAETQSGDADSYSSEWKRVGEEDLAGLQSWIATVPFTPDCELFEIYDGVTEIKPLPEAFILNELRRILDLARGDPKNKSYYSQIEAFAMIEEGQAPALYGKIVKILAVELDSPVPQLRRFAAYFIGDFMTAGHTSAQMKLRELVQKDPDFRVRCLAHQTLKCQQAEHPNAMTAPLPNLSLVDRIRMETINSNNLFEYSA